MNDDLRTIRVAAAYTPVVIGDPNANTKAILDSARKIDADIIVYPELCITGYTCSDLFSQTLLLETSMRLVDELAGSLPKSKVVIVGLPYKHEDDLYNCAAVLADGEIKGIVPKSYLPNYKEFYEKRWFKPAYNVVFQTHDDPIPFGTNLLFGFEQGFHFGVEICEDLWSVIPPSSFQAISGATILFNLSASNELVAKSEYRRNMVAQQSGRCIAAYVYCSCGPTESTADVVFGGHCIIADNGNIIKETERFKEEDCIIADIDIEKLINDRNQNKTFGDSGILARGEWRVIPLETDFKEHKPTYVNPNPFVPSDPKTLKDRCEEIFNIQVAGLIKRLKRVGGLGKYTIGISGGLDSTLAALVLYKAFKKLDWGMASVDAITMPGFGTSEKTLTNSLNLIQQLGFKSTTIDIKDACLQAFRDMGHKPFGVEIDADWSQSETKTDLVFENVQARMRTFYLMNRGFVVGTGDMSELALGWATYNGDHMSMYNVNCSIPKTLVKFLVKYVAENEVEDEGLKATLMSIYGTTISPELLPLGKDGEIVHSTEDLVGPYELHDFFLYHFVKNGFRPFKIKFLAYYAFPSYDRKVIDKWLKMFLKRFFANQFKRDCVPNGPKVGSVSLSPRGDWRMPPDADPTLFLQDV